MAVPTHLDDFLTIQIGQNEYTYSLNQSNSHIIDVECKDNGGNILATKKFKHTGLSLEEVQESQSGGGQN